MQKVGTGLMPSRKSEETRKSGAGETETGGDDTRRGGTTLGRALKAILRVLALILRKKGSYQKVLNGEAT